MTFKFIIERNRSQAPIPADVYLAPIVQMIELGLHSEDFQGQHTVRQKIGITYEIVSELRQANGAPSLLIEEYNQSTYQKSRLVPVLQACFSNQRDVPY